MANNRRKRRGPTTAKAAPGQPYGDRQATEVPIPNAAAAASQDFASVLAQAQLADPNLPTQMNAPTERPDEPVTAGLPMGAGPGPSPGMANAGGDETVALLSELYRQDPGNRDLRRLLEAAQNAARPFPGTNVNRLRDLIRAMPGKRPGAGIPKPLGRPTEPMPNMVVPNPEPFNDGWRGQLGVTGIGTPAGGPV